MISEEDLTQQAIEYERDEKGEEIKFNENKTHHDKEKNRWKWWININWWYRSFEIGENYFTEGYRKHWQIIWWKISDIYSWWQ